MACDNLSDEEEKYKRSFDEFVEQGSVDDRMAGDDLTDEEKYRRSFPGYVDAGSVDDIKISNDAGTNVASQSENDLQDRENEQHQLDNENQHKIENILSEDDKPTGKNSAGPDIKDGEGCQTNIFDRNKISNRLKHLPSFYILLMCMFICCSDGTIEVSSPGFPLHFGSPITLTCSCNESGFTATAWLKGDEKMQLAIGNRSTDIHKYLPSIHYEEDVYVYCLTIQTFDMTDLDVYSCQFDFVSKMLSLKRELFIYLPNKDEIDITTEKDLDVINITVNIDRIYPVVNCNIIYKGIDLSNQSSSTTTSKAGFYNVELHTLIPIHHACSGILEISCLIRRQRYLILKHVVNACALKEKKTDELTIIVSTLGPVVFVVVIVLGICYNCKKRKTGRTSVTEDTSVPEGESFIAEQQTV